MAGKLTPERAAMLGRIAGLTTASRTDSIQRTAHGRAALLKSIEDEVDPDHQLPEKERQRRVRENSGKVDVQSLEAFDGGNCLDWFANAFPPARLRQYQEMIPDAPERMFSLSERLIEHRIETEKQASASDFKRSSYGLIVTSFFKAVAFVLAFYMTYEGSVSAAAVVISIVFGSGLAGFVRGPYSRGGS